MLCTLLCLPALFQYVLQIYMKLKQNKDIPVSPQLIGSLGAASFNNCKRVRSIPFNFNTLNGSMPLCFDFDIFSNCVTIAHPSFFTIKPFPA